ncbi:MAG: ApaG protein [Saprospiraceae bacterium]|jgi:ApaG protein
MNTLITNGIKVSVEVFYQPFQSQLDMGKFIFAYRVTIENVGAETVQLQRRHWFISDSNGENREVEGEGVIGETPILAPGQVHRYNSWCSLLTSIGKMGGFFTMINLKTREQFEVVVPDFQMIAPFKAN